MQRIQDEIIRPQSHLLVLKDWIKSMPDWAIKPQSHLLVLKVFGGVVVRYKEQSLNRTCWY